MRRYYSFMFSDSKCEDVRSCSCWSGLHLGKLQFRKSMVDGNIILIKHLNTLGQKTAGGTDLEHAFPICNVANGGD